MPITTTLIEVVVGVHFEGNLSLSVLDLASWANEFADFDQFQQTAPLPPLQLVPQPGFQVSFAPEAPRLIRRNREGYLVQLQGDRFVVGWQKPGPFGAAAEYPGFPTIKTQWLRLLERFYKWHGAKVGGSPPSRLIELTYVNLASRKIDGRNVRISEVLRFYQPSKPRAVNQFQMNWGELLDTQLNSGRIQAQFSVGQMPDGEPAYNYSFSGIAPINGSAASTSSIEGLEALHARIIDMFDAAIISDADAG